MTSRLPLANEHVKNGSDAFKRDLRVARRCRDVVEAWNEGCSPSHYHWLIGKLTKAIAEARPLPADIVDNFKPHRPFEQWHDWTQPKKDTTPK